MSTSLRILALTSTAGLVLLILDTAFYPSAGWILVVLAVLVAYLLWMAGVLVHHVGRDRLH